MCSSLFLVSIGFVYNLNDPFLTLNRLSYACEMLFRGR
jgi:hypothetical protein